MLTSKEYRLNILCFEILSYFCIIPAEINGVDVKRPTVKRLILWSPLVTTQVVYFVMAWWFMLKKILSDGQDAIPTLTIDYSIIVLAYVAIYFAIQNFICWPEVAQTVLMCVQVCNINKRERKGAIFGYTFLEIYTMLVPLGIYPAASAMAAAYCLIYILPITEGLHIAIRILSILAETLVVLSLAAWVHFGLIIHITFMEKVGFTIKNQLKQLEQNVDDDQIQGVPESIQELRALQVETNAFNESQKSIIFAFKLGTMFAVIFCGFAAIQFFHVNLMMGMCNVVVVVSAIFAFGFSYNKGFSIPRSIQALQRSLMFHVRLNGDAKDRRCMEFKRQIKSIRRMAVEVGNFHYLQRVSTPNFVDFSVKNMVRLVMFYRRHKA